MAGEPVVSHPWLGELQRLGPHELRALIEVDPAVRPPRRNGSRDAEVLIEITGLEPDLRAHLDHCAARAQKVLADLPSIRRYAIRSAARDWLDHDLFFEGVEIDPQGHVSVLFDVGDLDLLVVELDETGHGKHVVLRP